MEDTNTLSNILRYYRACYMADNREQTIWNFFGDKIEKPFFIEQKEELINGFLPYYPVDAEKGKDIQKSLSLYAKEKELVYCTFFITGETTDFGGRLQKICSPLFIYPAKIVHENDEFYVAIELHERRINFSVLTALFEKQDSDTGIIDLLYKELPGTTIEESDVAHISKLFKQFIPDLNTDALLQYPELLTSKQVKAISLESSNGAFKLLPASAAGIISKSSDTLGIINELATIAEQNEFSKPLIQIFDKNTTEQPKTVKLGKVPAILNNAQLDIAQSAARFSNVLVVGPPGTGKSYTIGALAVEHLSRGQTVLIACRTDQAVDVVADKIENQLGIKDIIIRGGRKNYLRDLRETLQNLLNGINPHTEATSKKVSQLSGELKKIDSQVQKLEKQFTKRVEKEKQWGKFWVDKKTEDGFFTNLKRKYIGWQNKRTMPMWQLISELEKTLQIQISKTIQYIENRYGAGVNDSLRRNWNDISHLAKALRARTGTKQEEYFDMTNFDKILRTFPVWLVKMSDIYKILPLRKELFDLAIIDEATQCDVASCIPIIQRAKRVVFAGDPNQLRHVSFLSTARQQQLQEKFGLEKMPDDMLNYRDKSILDLITDAIKYQEQVVFLNEHYRSLPAIINYSNRKFYSSALRVMTSKPGIASGEGLTFIPCNGVRTQQGYNVEEAEFIIGKIQEIIETEKHLPPQLCKQVGVLSPFRAQVDYLSGRFEKLFTIEQIERHRLTIGTAYSFQGEERDVMFLSLNLDNQSHHTAFHHLNKNDVFNVSITRARSLQYVCYSMDISQLKTESLLREYFENYKSGMQTPATRNDTKDVFMDEVTAELKALEFKIWTAYPIAGQTIDLIIAKADKIYGIDLIGYPGEYEDSFSIERYKMLNRAGLQTFPLPYTFWTIDRAQCLREICGVFG